MNIVSPQYIVFIILISFIYWLSKNEYRKYVLLLASIIFCALQGLWQFVYTVSYLLISFLLAKYFTHNRVLYAIGIILSLVPLLLSKYLRFLQISIVGISYMTFRVISYIVETKTKRINNVDLIDYVIYILFFPSLLCGPIEKSTSFIEQLNENKKENWNNVIRGFLLISYGFLVKYIAVERMLPIINYLYDNYSLINSYVIVGVIMYSFYIYFEFSSYSNIAYGTAVIFGFEITNNFKQPYLSKSNKEFWNRWHISLNRWFIDYIYIPLGGNKKGKLRKYVNIIVVFVVSAIWHGTGANYLVWGILNALIQIISDIFNKVKLKSLSKCFNRKLKYLVNVLTTFLLISFTWIFFSNSEIAKAFSIVKSIFIKSNMSFNKFISLLFEEQIISYLGIALIALIFVIVVVKDILAEQNIDIFSKIANSNIVIRYLVLFAIIWFVILFGFYGDGIDHSKFIYLDY